MKKLLAVVDYQVDFVEGSLSFDGAEKFEPGILKEIETTLAEGGYVLFTRDTHGDDYLDTREGRFIDIPHCVKGTRGHQLYGGLHTYETDPRPNTVILDKPVFGCADIGVAAEKLVGGTPDVIQICGLVTDICVVTNAIIFHSYFPETPVQVLSKLVGSGNAQNANAALQVLRGLGIEIIE